MRMFLTTMRIGSTRAESIAALIRSDLELSGQQLVVECGSHPQSLKDFGSSNTAVLVQPSSSAQLPLIPPRILCLILLP
jgi:hypothetical protein